MRSFDRHIVRRLHFLPVVDRRWNQLEYSTDQWCGFQVIVIEPTVALVLSRVVPPFAEVILRILVIGGNEARPQYLQ